jgi:Zn-dependent protease
MMDVGLEVQSLREAVERHFRVYDVRIRPEALTFFVHVDAYTLDERFDRLRRELVPQRYIPLITKEGGEHVIHVQRRPERRAFSFRVNMVLLLATIVTTIIAGAQNWAGYVNIDWLTMEAFANGAVFFAVPLLAILGIHEMGHYVMARRYHVSASLPFFIPSVPPLGTFGAVISMRDPIPNRRALLDIGAAGPLLGLAVAVPVTLIGLWLIQVAPIPAPANLGGQAVIQAPILFQMLTLLVPVPAEATVHPTAFAGWVGIFVTALNLLPAGQLDGGHIARALLGDKARYLSYAAIFFMIILAPLFFSWLIIALLILFIGARHPPPLNDLVGLDATRQAVGVFVVGVLLISFVAVPIDFIPPEYAYTFLTSDPPFAALAELNVTVPVGGLALVAFRVANAGNTFGNMTLSLPDLQNVRNVGLDASFAEVRVFDAATDVLVATVVGAGETVAFGFNSTEYAVVVLAVDAGNYQGLPDAVWQFSVGAVMDHGPEETLTVRVTVTP